MIVKKRRLRYIVLLLLIILVLFSAGFTAFHAYSVRCYFVAWSGLSRLETNVYVDPAMPASEQDSLLADISPARARVKNFLGPIQAHVVIIAGQDMKIPGYFGGASDKTGLTQTFLSTSYIVLAPAGLTLDVLSHEMTHAELAARIGDSAYGKLPPWFNEGMAMYDDYRAKYTEMQYMRLTDNGKYAPSLHTLSTAQGFYSGSDQQVTINYLTAKHEFACWYHIVGPQGLAQLITALHNGKALQPMYTTIERQVQSFFNCLCCENQS